MSDDFSEIPELVPFDAVLSSDDYEEDEEDSMLRLSEPTMVMSDEAEEDEVEDDPILPRKVTPLTLLTGWLGSGKTTFLHHVLEEYSNSGKTVAILQNETSELMGVERALKIQDDSGTFGEILELKNGCVCCSVRSNFLIAVDELLQKRDFDYVLVECSGIADPGKLTSMFWVDDQLESRVYLDGVISVADASLLPHHLRGSRAHSDVVIAQIAYADRVILNKTDLVNEQQLEEVEASIKALNGNAPVIRATRSNVSLDDVLLIRSLRLGRSLRDSIQEAFDAAVTTGKNRPTGEKDMTRAGFTDHVHSHSGDHACKDVKCTQGCSSSSSSSSVKNLTSTPSLNTKESSALVPDHIIDGVAVYRTKHTSSTQLDVDSPTPTIDHGISTYVFSHTSPSTEEGAEANRGMSLHKLKLWLTQLLHEESQALYDKDLAEMISEEAMCIFRMKAVLAIHGQRQRYYLQAVQATFELDKADSNDKIDTEEARASLEQDLWPTNAPRESRLIVIGTHIDYKRIAHDFASCFV